MKRILLVLLFAVAGSVQAAEFEGVFQAKGLCQHFCEYRKAEIKILPADSWDVERVEIRLDNSRWDIYGKSYTLKAEKSHSRNIDTRSELRMTEDSLRYSYYRYVYGLRDSAGEQRNIEIKKNADGTFTLSIAEVDLGAGTSGRWRHYEYVLTK